MAKFIIVLAATLALVLAGAEPAYADHLLTKLDVAAHTSARLQNEYELKAHLQLSDGRPLGSENVRFYETVDFFGERDMFIGAATTDGSGYATIDYLPARIGPHQLVIRFGGHEHYAPAVARFTLDATVAAPAPRAERSALATFSDRVPYAVAIVVLSVWAVIAFALIATARSVIGAQKPRKEEPA